MHSTVEDTKNLHSYDHSAIGLSNKPSDNGTVREPTMTTIETAGIFQAFVDFYKD